MKDIATLIKECVCDNGSYIDVEKINNDLKRIVPGIIVMISPDGKLEIEPPVDYEEEDFTDEDLEKIYDYISNETNIEFDLSDPEDEEYSTGEDEDYYDADYYGDEDGNVDENY